MRNESRALLGVLLAAMAVSAPVLAQDASSPATSSTSTAPDTSNLTGDEALARKGDAGAIRRVMQHYLDAGDAKAALPWAKMGAEKNDTACQIALATLLAGTDAGPADLTHAFMWADIAAAKHDADLGADAEAVRDDIRHKASIDQILDAKALSAKWRAAHK